MTDDRILVAGPDSETVELECEAWGGAYERSGGDDDDDDDDEDEEKVGGE